MGIVDVKNVFDAISYAKANLKISDAYVMGNSYGGYLALRAIVEKPSLFKGAISINGVTDWESLLVQLRTSIFNVYFDGLPNALNQSEYAQASILSRIAGLTKNQNILLVKGEEDTTIPPKQTDLLYAALLEQGKKTELLSLSGQNHIISDRSSLQGLCKGVFATLDLPVSGDTCELK